MGELAAKELAQDLEDEWTDGDIGCSVFSYMRLTETEYAVWVSRRELPRDFEARHLA